MSGMWTEPKHTAWVNPSKRGGMDGVSRQLGVNLEVKGTQLTEKP